MNLKYQNKVLLILALLCLPVVALADCQSFRQLTHGPWQAAIQSIGENGGCSIQTLNLAIGTRDLKQAELTVRGSDPITDAWLTDLDANREPELILVTTSAGSGGYGRLQLYRPEQNTLQVLPLPQLSDHLLREYRGHDRYFLQDSLIVREFPIYRASDPNCCPSGGLRRLFYRFDGEALSLVP
jgi:hypothetical protein